MIADTTDRSRATDGALLRLSTMAFVYEPYPVGWATSVFAPEMYRELVATWPPTELFEFKPELGRKYSLSEVNHPEKYFQFLRSAPAWRRFFESVKTPSFVHRVLGLLDAHSVELDLQSTPVGSVNPLAPWSRRLARALRRRLRRSTSPAEVLNTRFEFSALPADGGCIKPHTDNPNKLITLVLSMVEPGEWDPRWGGGTAILRTIDPRRNFNFVNRQMEFADCEVLRTFEFIPNQCVLFVKTFNSHHAVLPMTGAGTGVLRRTLTINIERLPR